MSENFNWYCHSCGLQVTDANGKKTKMSLYERDAEFPYLISLNQICCKGLVGLVGFVARRSQLKSDYPSVPGNFQIPPPTTALLYQCLSHALSTVDYRVAEMKQGLVQYHLLNAGFLVGELAI